MNTKTDSPSADETTSLVDVAQAAVAPAETSTPDANEAAGTSAAGEDQGANTAEPSLEDVIRAANKPAEAAADTPADGKGDTKDPGSKPEEAAAKDGDKPAEAKTDEDEDKDVPFHKHPRWQQLKGQRDELKTKVTELTTEIEPLRTKAGQLDQIGTFMRDNMLTPQNVEEGFQVMALMVSDPAAALEKLYEQVEKLELHLGKRLPDDIRQRVDAGEVNAEAAAELARQRAEAQAHRTRADYLEQENRNTVAMSLQRDIKQAVGAFENEIKSTDPDYAHKQTFIMDRMKLLASQNPPKSAEDAVAIARQAHRDVTEALKKAIPQKQPATVVKSEHTSSNASQPTPKSLLDVVRQAATR